VSDDRVASEAAETFSEVSDPSDFESSRPTMRGERRRCLLSLLLILLHRSGVGISLPRVLLRMELGECMRGMEGSIIAEGVRQKDTSSGV